MFDIGFTELMIIGVVALIVIGPERLPKVARTVGHLYGRMQRYVSTVKADISNEIQLDELRKAGQGFKESIESVQADVQQQATVVDDYLREEANTIDKAVKTMGTPGDARPAAESALPQQSLPLDEPDQNTVAATPAAVVENAHGEATGKTP